MSPNGLTRNVPKHNLALRQLHIISEDVLKVFTDKEKCYKLKVLRNMVKRIWRLIYAGNIKEAVSRNLIPATKLSKT